MFANADSYERFMGRWSAKLAPLLTDFGRIPRAGYVLDVGSGSGALSFSLAARFPHLRVKGVDRSPEFVDSTASRNSVAGRLSFEGGDAQMLPFADATFDAASSLLVLNFIPDSGTAISEVRRVTKPGGWISAAVWDYGAGMRMLRVFWDAAVSLDEAAEKGDEKHMPLCREGELFALWKGQGLKRIEASPLDFEMDFASFADFWEPFLEGQGPAGAYVQSLDPEARAALGEEVLRRLGLSSRERAFRLEARAWAVRGVVP
ncbi:MAG: class I SAM-dependent methyltransferase [Bryobacterales bacterium]